MRLLAFIACNHRFAHRSRLCICPRLTVFRVLCTSLAGPEACNSIQRHAIMCWAAPMCMASKDLAVEGLTQLTTNNAALLAGS